MSDIQGPKRERFNPNLFELTLETIMMINQKFLDPNCYVLKGDLDEYVERLRNFCIEGIANAEKCISDISNSQNKVLDGYSDGTNTLQDVQVSMARLEEGRVAYQKSQEALRFTLDGLEDFRAEYRRFTVDGE